MSGIAVSVVESSPIERCKYCLVGVPDVGLVGSIALGYLIDEEKMIEVGYFESDYFPPVIVVHKGEPRPPFRIYHKGDVAAIFSEMPVDPRLIPYTARSIVDWAKSKGVALLTSLSGIAVQNRLEIDVPEVYGVSSSNSIRSLIKDAGIKLFEEGFLAGLHADVMRECLKKNVPNMILFAQSHLRYPDPGAAASLVSSLNILLGLEVDTKRLLAQEDEIRLKMRELMQRTQQQMRQAQKGREQEIPLMYT